MERCYYKSKDGKAIYNVKSPMLDEDLISITKEEYENLTKKEPLTDEQIAQAKKLEEIAVLKAKLAETDYQALKYAEGWISEEDYAPIKAARQAIRDQINELEGE